MRSVKLCSDLYRTDESGTRCHQLATYVIFESPLNMLCDNPSNYNREPECTEFIANIPTVWEKTVALDGKVGEFVAIARLHVMIGMWAL